MMAAAASGSSHSVLQGSNLTAETKENAHNRPRDGDGDIVYYHYTWEGGNPDFPALALPPNTTVPGGGDEKIIGTKPARADDWKVLESANSKVAAPFLWLVIVLALLLLLAVLGSALVCVVYRTRFRRNTASCFVVFLAIMQLVFMIVGVPMEMSTLALPLLFRSGVACKVVRYVETASVLSLLLTLTAIALDRFCKLSKPTNFLTMPWAKGLCAGAVILGLVFASPAFFVFGNTTVNLSFAANLTGKQCGVDNSYSHSVKIVYVSLILFIFLFALVTMAVLYIFMYIRICRRKAASRGERVSPARPYRHRFVAEDSTSSCGGGEETRRFPTSSSSTSTSMLGATPPRSGRTSPGVDPARVPLKPGVKESARIGQGSGTVVDVQSTQMTWIFFLVSFSAIVVLAPFMVLRSFHVLTGFRDSMNEDGMTVLYEVAMRLYFFHPPLVPFLYLLCNPNFLREVKQFLRKVGKSCKRQSSSPARAHSAG